MKPYDIRPSGNLYVLYDVRTGAVASYPTSKSNANREKKFMNEQYAKLMVEEES